MLWWKSGLKLLFPFLLKDSCIVQWKTGCHFIPRLVVQSCMRGEMYSFSYHQGLFWVLSRWFFIFLCTKSRWSWILSENNWVGGKVFQIWLLQYFFYVSNIFSLTLLGHIFIIRRALAVSNKPKMENLREALLLLQLLLCHLYSPYFSFCLHHPQIRPKWQIQSCSNFYILT